MANPCSSYDLLVLLLLLLVSGLGALQSSGANQDEPPVVFIFGDSTVDVGTNNYLPNSGAKSNFPYNGIDFANSMPTGRFSNGFNTADQIVRLLGLMKSPQPYFTLLQDPSNFKQNVLRGVNFASGGAGILDPTGNQTYREVVSLGQQVQQFQLVQGNITEVLGPSAATLLLSKSLFLISVGSNDIFDYFLYNRTTISQPQLMASLNSTYSNHLKSLVSLGACKLGIVSVPLIGCCPYARLLNMTATGSPGCLTELNDYAQAFGPMVAALLEGLSSEQNGAVKYSLGDAYTMTSTMLDDPLGFGIKNIQEACCGSGPLNAEKPCLITESPNLCPNRDEYLFWDMFHPTEHAAELAALALYGGLPPLVGPMNFSQLVEI